MKLAVDKEMDVFNFFEVYDLLDFLFLAILGLSLEEMPCQVAFAGDQVTVTVAGIDMQNVSLGYILCDPQNPIPSTSRIEARIVLFNLQVPVTQGFPVIQYKCQL
jgi:translation elongation factor EF-1alpha